MSGSAPAWREPLLRSWDEWDGRLVVASPDVDGLLCAALAAHLRGARLAGLYTTSSLLLLDGADLAAAKDALWLDHDIFHPDILCFGQHLINFAPHDTRDFQSGGCFNPNEFFGQVYADSFSGVRGKRRDKYPFGTIHFLLAALDGGDENLTSSRLAVLAHADGVWANCIKYPVNCEIWRNLMFGEDLSTFFVEVLGSYPKRGDQHEVHLNLVRGLQAAGVSRRGSESAGAGQIPDHLKPLQGMQAVAYAHGHDLENYLGKVRRVLDLLKQATGWNVNLPDSVSSAHRAEVAQDYPDKVEKRGFRNFMTEEKIFSHAIKGQTSIRFTRSFLG